MMWSQLVNVEPVDPLTVDDDPAPSNRSTTTYRPFEITFDEGRVFCAYISSNEKQTSLLARSTLDDYSSIDGKSGKKDFGL